MPDSNPFATRFVRPGAIDFLFPAGQSAQSLVADLKGHGWWGEIVGPHGSGKSTLLATLEPELIAQGRDVLRCSVPLGELPPLGPRTQLVLDGYEQLSWWSRWRIAAHCRRRQAGLLVSAHRALGLPPLYRTLPSEELARQVVARLVPASDGTIGPEDVRRAYAQTGGNLRETLFALYDVYQSRH